jgi:hypothetical protein
MTSGPPNDSFHSLVNMTLTATVHAFSHENSSHEALYAGLTALQSAVQLHDAACFEVFLRYSLMRSCETAGVNYRGGNPNRSGTRTKVPTL